MNSKPLRLVLASLVLMAMTMISAGAQTMPAQDNAWVTGNGAQMDFSNFGSVNIQSLLGAAPTSSTVTLNGVPLNSQLGSADTLVQTGQVDVTSGTNRANLTLEALNMASSPDMTLTDGRVYHITVGLAHSGSGYADFTRTAGTDGGTYNSSFTVVPTLTFTNVANSSDTKTIDCSQPGNTCSFSMTGTGGNWVLSSSTGFDPATLGIPVVPAGVTVGGYTTIGRSRYGALYPGVVHSPGGGYATSGNNEVESAGNSWHKPNPPTDCKGTVFSTGLSSGATATRSETTGQAATFQKSVALCPAIVSTQ